MRIGELDRRVPTVLVGPLAAVIVALVAGAAGVVAIRATAPPAAALTTVGSGDLVSTLSRELDHRSLGSALRASGVPLPSDANVYAAIVRKGPNGVAYEAYEAGGGSLAADFWPASSVKPMAVIGALEFLSGLGFTGSATVTFPGGESSTVRRLYESAISASSNEAYDRLVQIAGVDWLNTRFLTPANGFPESVIQKSYVDVGGLSSPPMQVQEAGRVVDLPARRSSGDYGVPDDGNRSTLLEMTEAVGRIVLDGDLPAGDRFGIDPADVLGIRQALLEADGFLGPGALSALGQGTLVYDKPGYVVGDDCVDVGLVESPDRSQSYLLGVSTPDDGRSCETLAEIAEGTLDFLSARG